MNFFTEDQNFRINGVRKVTLTTGPQLHPFSSVQTATKNYYCNGVDTKGFQYEIDLQAMPPGVSIDQLGPNQVWWVEKRTSLYRIYLYGGVYDPVTRQINTTAPLPTPTVSGNYLPISGGTISGNLTVTGTATLQGGLYVTSPLVGGVTATNGQSLVYNGTQWAPATISGGTVSGNYLPISGGTVSGNLVVASGLTVSGALTVGSEVDTGAMTVGGNLTVTGTTTLNNTLAANSGITLGQATNINFLTGGGYQLSVSGSNPGTIIIPGPGLGSTDTLATLNGTQTLSNKTLATTTVSGNLVVASGLTVSGTVTATGIQISESQVTNLTTDLAAKFPYSGGTISGNLTVASGLTVSGGINISGTLAYNGQTVPSTNYIANYNSGYGPATGYVLTYNPGLGVIYNNSITGGLILQGASSVQSTLTVTSGLTVTGTTTLGSGYVSVSGSGTSGYITVGGAGGLVSAANINGTSGVFSSSLTSSGTLFVTGTSTHVGNATFSGTITSNAYLPNVASITATSNAATVSGSTYTSTKVTNNSAATLAITMSTTGAVDGMQAIVRILDFSAVAQTISWTNTENSQVSAPTTSNGSTTLPLTVGFIYNGSTSKWRCVAVA